MADTKKAKPYFLMELESSHLEIGYDGKKIAVAERLKLSTGKLTGIIGINGAGKSTLLHTLEGNLKPVTGYIKIDRKPIAHFDQTEIARKMSIVRSNSSISGALKAGEIISLGRQPYTDWLGRLSKVDRNSIDEAMLMLKVTDLKNRYFNQLSDGQKQRVMIARALAQDTPFILLDEPVTHLDLYHQAMVFDILKKITQDKNKAVVFSSHQVNELLDICDDLIVIHQREITQKSVTNWLEDDQLADLFPSGYVKFDKETKRFRLK